MVNELQFTSGERTGLVTKHQQQFTTTQKPLLTTNDSTAPDRTLNTNSTTNNNKKRRKGKRISARKRKNLVKEFRNILKGARSVPENFMEKIKVLFQLNTKVKRHPNQRRRENNNYKRRTCQRGNRKRLHRS